MSMTKLRGTCPRRHSVVILASGSCGGRPVPLGDAFVIACDTTGYFLGGRLYGRPVRISTRGASPGPRPGGDARCAPDLRSGDVKQASVARLGLEHSPASRHS